MFNIQIQKVNFNRVTLFCYGKKTPHSDGRIGYTQKAFTIWDRSWRIAMLLRRFQAMSKGSTQRSYDKKAFDVSFDRIFKCKHDDFTFIEDRINPYTGMITRDLHCNICHDRFQKHIIPPFAPIKF